MKRCRECKAQYPDDAQFCPVEGSVLDDVVGTVASDQIIEDKFRLGKVLGGNRTGTVYEAFRISDESVFALKIVHKEIFPTPILASRAQRELKNLAQIKAAQVVKIQDFGLHRASIWLAMEVCTDETLTSVLNKKQLTLPESLDIAEQVSKGLEAAAKSGVIHRDLSPKNILLNKDLKVSLINFSVPVKGKEHVGVTSYMAPEQLKGTPPDLRSNIYSLATILYQCIEGKRAFDGDGEKVSLAQQKLPVFDRCDEENVQHAIEKSLNLEPSKRFMTFREMVKALRSPSPTIKENIAMSNKDEKANPDESKNKTLMGFASPEVAKMKKEIDAAKKANEVKEAKAIGTPAPVNKRSPGRISAPPPIPKMSGSNAKPLAENVTKSNKDSESTLKATKIQEEPASQQNADKNETKSLKPKENQSMNKPSKDKKEEAAEKVEAKEEISKVESKESESKLEKASNVLAAPVLAAPKIAEKTQGLKKPQVGKGVGGKGKATANVPEPASKDKKGKFRETMWFKKGELDEAAAEAASEKRKKDELVSDKADEMGIDERYNDDGTITDSDKERLSLRTGSTMMEPVRNVVSRNDVSEHDLISEMKGNRTKVFACIAAGVLALIVIAALVF